MKDKIYRHAIVLDEPIEIRYASRNSYAALGREFFMIDWMNSKNLASILCIDKEAREEAIKIFYSKNIFSFRNDYKGCAGGWVISIAKKNI
jgi:hypothetical protein